MFRLRKRTSSKHALIAGDEKGTSTVELALVMPVVAGLLVATIDATMGFAEKLRVEAAAARAIEQVTAYSKVQSDYATSVTEAAAAARVDPSNVTLTKWRECDRVVQENFDGTCADNDDQIGRFIKVTISGSFTPVINYGGLLDADAHGVVAVNGDASVRIQ